MKKIAIFTAIGCQNLGDELILKNEIEYIKKEEKSAHFYVFSYDLDEIFYKKDYISYTEYFPIGIKNPKNIWKNIKNYFKMIQIFKNCDEVIFGGGGIIYDNEFQSTSNPLNLRIFRAKLAKLLGCKVKSHAIGINIKNEENYKKLKALFENFDDIKIRDVASKNHLEKVGIKSEIIKDPVFSESDGKGKILQKLNAKTFESNQLDYSLLEGKNVGVAIRDGYANREKFEEMIKTLLKNVKSLTIIPFSFHKDDSKANDYIFMEGIAKKYGIKITKNLAESYDYCKEKNIDVMIGMRLHSIILSYIYGIDLITISYSSKTEEIIKTLD